MTRNSGPKGNEIHDAGSFRSWFHLALLIFNIMFCLRLIISGGYSWWLLAIPPVSFPLSGIILTWTARISAVIRLGREQND